MYSMRHCKLNMNVFTMERFKWFNSKISLVSNDWMPENFAKCFFIMCHSLKYICLVFRAKVRSTGINYVFTPKKMLSDIKKTNSVFVLMSDSWRHTVLETITFFHIERDEPLEGVKCHSFLQTGNDLKWSESVKCGQTDLFVL